MFDIQATIKWVTEVLRDPDAAAAAYKSALPEEAGSWQQSFVQITLPVYVAGGVFGYILALITGGSFMYGGVGIGFFLFGLLWSLGWTFVIAFIFDYLSGMFDGTRNFDAAYAVVALAIIPAALGTGLAPLPWFGWLISLAASIYSLTLAYRFIPTFLQLPDESRVKHFAISIVAAIVVNIIVSATVGSMFAPSVSSFPTGGYDSSSESGSDAGTDFGVLGGLERQAGFAEQAANDAFEPPDDGRLSEDQVEQYVSVLRKTGVLRDRLTKRFEDLDEEEASISDIFGGMNDAVRLSTAEMEVVKTAGGNWAEHQWVKNQIEVARVQQDINDTVKHNYALFMQFQEEIEQHE
ncbi:MAG: YIP1 family protein [Gammaproteobacteria bacterium]|nr:YIP1 family protein [Gammaproteobacteria bacterium]